MRKVSLFSCIAGAGLVLALSPTADAASAWTPTGRIPGALTPSVAYNATGSMAYAGGIGVIYRSADEGRRWTPSNLPAAYRSSLVLSIAASAVNKQFLLASTQDISLSGGAGVAVLASADGGSTWAVPTGLPNQVSSGNSQYPYYPAWDPKTAATAYASISGGENGVYRTVNGGKTWSLAYRPTMTSYPFPIGPVAAVPTNPVSIYMASSDYGYSTNGNEYIAKSSNSGTSFKFVDPLDYVGFPGYGTIFTAFGYDPKTPSTVYALASGTQNQSGTNVDYLKFLWTPNAGVNWVSRINGLPKSVEASALAVDPSSRDVMMALCCAEHHALYVSDNQGKSWALGGVIPQSTYSLAVEPGHKLSEPATLLSGGRGGPMVSVNGGKSWANRLTGMAQPNIADIVADPTTPTLLYVGTKAGVMRSANGGRTFSPIVARMTDLNVEALALDVKGPHHVLYAATISGVYVCHNPAAAAPVWSEVTPPGMRGRTGSYALSVDDATAGRLYVSNVQSSPREIYRTDDYGAQWVTTDFHNATGNDYPEAIIADPKAPGTVYATAEDFAGVYKSTNAGKTFTEIFEGLNGTRFFFGQKDALNPRTLYLVGPDPNSRKTTIRRSTDGGRSWDANTDSAPGGGALLDIAADPKSSRVYALVAVAKTVRGQQQLEMAVYRSPNRAYTWTNVTGTLPATLPVATHSNVTTRATLRATGDTLAIAAPLTSVLYQQKLR